MTSVAEISCVDAEGKRLIVRWQADTIPYTPDDRRASEAVVRANGRYTAADAEAILAARQYPSRFNPFDALQLDTEGNFWILELTLDQAGKHKPRFRVLNPEGRLIAFADYFPVRVIGSSTNVDIASDAVVRVLEDADGVPKVGVFRIRKNP